MNLEERPPRRLGGLLVAAALFGCSPAPATVGQADPKEPATGALSPAKEGARPPAEAAAPPPPPPPCADDDPVGCTFGCDEGRDEDCATLGTIYLTGELVTVDPGRALALFRKACEAGSVRGCVRLADAHHQGLADSPAEETELYRKACRGGANHGCVSAGQAYLDGRGVTADPTVAASLFYWACQRGNPAGCFELGRLFRVGDGVAEEPARALVLFHKACQLGHEGACLYLERMAEQGLELDE